MEIDGAGATAMLTWGAFLLAILAVLITATVRVGAEPGGEADAESPAAAPATGPAASQPTTVPTEFDADAIARWVPKAPPLPAPTGKVVRVADAEQLRSACRDAEKGTTILLADGRYPIEELLITTDGLTLRSASGDREKVVLDGGDRFTKVVRIRGAKDLTIADLTVANCRQYGIFFLGDSDVQRLKVYNVKFHNIWVRGLKGTHAQRINDSGRRLMSVAEAEKIRPRDGQVRYCLFVNDRVKPYEDDGFRGDYVSGMDMMWLDGWTIADNVFVGIRGRHGGGRGAIFIWVNSRNVTAERNVIVGCDRGICFGNPSGDRLHMTGGVVRNNFIVGGTRLAMEICRTKDTVVAHNTLLCRSPSHVAVMFYQGSTGGRCVNNLAYGRFSLARDVERSGDYAGPVDGWFADPAAGDLHLTGRPPAELARDRLEIVPKDFDRQDRRPQTLAGADGPAGR